MDTVMQRRTFLKSLMAAAAIPIVASIPISAEQIKLEAVDASVPFTEHGDIWLRSGKIWKFIGKVKNFSIDAPMIDFTSFAEHHNEMAGIFTRPDINVSAISDEFGAREVAETLFSGTKTDVILGHRNKYIEFPKTFLISADQTFLGTEQMLPMSMTFTQSENPKMHIQHLWKTGS